MSKKFIFAAVASLSTFAFSLFAFSNALELAKAESKPSPLSSEAANAKPLSSPLSSTAKPLSSPYTPPVAAASTCQETDKGFDLFQRGMTISNNDPAYRGKMLDTCDGSQIVEYQCADEGKIKKTMQFCPHGNTCQNGACVPIITTGPVS